MSKFISLTRIIAINWYGFRQIIDVEDTILLSGVSGGGKSALLDLVQRVLLGENWRPNRAAAGAKKGRTEVSYVLCDTNAKENAEPHYTRRNGVSYIALEFTWPEEKKGVEPRRETWGWRIQYDSPTSTPSRVHFLIPARTDWTTYSRGNELLSEDEFKAMIRKTYGNNFLFSQREYRAEMATPHHLYFDEDRLLKTLPKAIAFEPEDDIEGFIREFILEEATIDVTDVRKSVQAYRETQERLAKQEDEATFLRKIRGYHQTFEREQRTAAILSHVRVVLEQLRLEEAVSQHKTRLAALEESDVQDNKNLTEKKAEKGRLESALKEFTLDASEADLQAKQSERKRKVQQKTDLQDAQRSARERLTKLAGNWRRWLQRGKEQPLEGVVDVLTVDPNVLDALGAIDEKAAFEALPTMANRFNDIFREVDGLVAALDTQIRSIDADLRDVAQQLDQLEAGQTPGDFPVFNLVKRALDDTPTPPEQLCRMVEIKPDAEADGWRRAIELILGRNRFAIIVGSLSDYRKALDILRQHGRNDESIIHPLEARDLDVTVRERSLAEKVEIGSGAPETRAIAESFVHHLIGRVHAAESLEDLDRAPGMGITRDAIFKQKPIRRKLTQHPRYDFTLGKEGLKRLRGNLLNRQNELMESRKAKQAVRNEVCAWMDLGKQWELGSTILPDKSHELYRLPELEEEITALTKHIEFLETPERSARLAKHVEMNHTLGRINVEIGRLNAARQEYQQRHTEAADALRNAESRLSNQITQVAASRGALPSDVLEAHTQEAIDALKAEFRTWDERKDAAETRAKKAGDKATNARRDRDQARSDMIAAIDKLGRPRHPEYRLEYDTAALDNKQWDARLDALEGFELQKYRKLAEDRRKDWENRLRDNVLSRLNNNILQAERTIRELRKYMDRTVRGFRYEITQRRDRAFDPLFALLSDGFEPTDPLSEYARASEVQEALDELMAAVEASTDKADTRAKQLLDYRFYHNYDMHMVPVAGGGPAQPISLGQSGSSLSGGENQVPFFISMLAAFRRVYDLGAKRSSHLGLVVMDEAFAKLSGDGIEDCLELAKEFNLQLFMAFPVDKLGIMVPFAQTIILCEKEEERDAKGYVSKVDNIPTRLTKEQAELATA